MSIKPSKSFTEYPQSLRNYFVHNEFIPQERITLKSKKIDEEARKIQLQNDAAEQDIKLKKTTLKILFLFLGIETLLIFIFALAQGVGYFLSNKFELEDWSFRLLISATLLQITYMLQVAVKHLFPTKNE